MGLRQILEQDRILQTNTTVGLKPWGSTQKSPTLIEWGYIGAGHNKFRWVHRISVTPNGKRTHLDSAKERCNPLLPAGSTPAKVLKVWASVLVEPGVVSLQ